MQWKLSANLEAEYAILICFPSNCSIVMCRFNGMFDYIHLWCDVCVCEKYTLCLSKYILCMKCHWLRFVSYMSSSHNKRGVCHIYCDIDGNRFLSCSIPDTTHTDTHTNTHLHHHTFICNYVYFNGQRLTPKALSSLCVCVWMKILSVKVIYAILATKTSHIKDATAYAVPGYSKRQVRKIRPSHIMFGKHLTRAHRARRKMKIKYEIKILGFITKRNWLLTCQFITYAYLFYLCACVSLLNFI